jgi:hypothetical protein
VISKKNVTQAGYTPDQQLPGSFPEFDNLLPLSPLSSELSDPSHNVSLQLSSPLANPNSEEEVDIILSGNAAQPVAP